MNYYLKLFLLSVAISMINVLLYLFLLQFQIVNNSSYIPQELGVIFLILIAIPVQFILLLLIAAIFKRSDLSIFFTSCVLIVTCFILLLLSSTEERATFNNEQEYLRTESYDYQQGISTPEGYPIRLLEGSGFAIGIRGHRTPYTLLEDNKVYSTQWGNGDTTFKSSMAGGVPVPNGLQLYWYSYLENKYYELYTKLDQKKIAAYFKDGFIRDNKVTLTNEGSNKGLYNGLVAGIAPGGEVVIWISGVNESKEIGVYKATEISADKITDDDKVTEEAQKLVLNDTCSCEDRPQFRRIVHNGEKIPFGIWTTKYRKKYNWKVKPNNFGHVKSAFNFYFYNGEAFVIQNEDVIKLDYKKQVLTKLIKFTFFKNQKKYKLFIQFDEEELFNHFEELTKNNPDEPLDLTITIRPDLKKTTVQLQSKDKILDFKKIEDIKISLR
ncbi:DUF2931 family protein [Flavobacterium sp. PL12]|uniref:DUF2931 family protein n=1 Tax=Flavobacterium sp. PL12 TaxID=3071718 RepID=UPI00319EBAF9